jgi:hypothetical protein
VAASALLFVQFWPLGLCSLFYILIIYYHSRGFPCCINFQQNKICRNGVLICYFFHMHFRTDSLWTGLNMTNVFYVQSVWGLHGKTINNTKPSLLKGNRGSYFRHVILFIVKSFKFYCIYKLEDPCCCSRNLRWHKHSPIPYQGTELFLSASPKPCNLDSIYLLEVHEA